tara:strand:+ start:572 stop:1087 length:516 start_codon:yes stop_codon:yes gene_type:complete
MAKNKNADAPTMVTLKPSWGRSFRRFVRDKDGAIVKELTFSADIATVVSDDEIDLLLPDIGNALVIAFPDEHGRVKIDWEGTAAVVEMRDGKSSQEPDPVASLIAAGLDRKIAELLVANGKALPDERLLSPEGVIAYVGADNSIEKLEGLGEASEKKVLAWIAAAKEKKAG